jgi:hypothetical protein
VKKRVPQGITWLGKEWQHFRILEEAAWWRIQDQPIPLGQDMARRYYLTEGGLLSRVQHMQKCGLVEVFTDSSGQTNAFRITHDEASLAGQLVAALFR